MSTIKIKQVKSRIGAPADQKRTLDALGLRKLNRVVEHECTPSILGMVDKVKHLVTIVTYVFVEYKTNYNMNLSNLKPAEGSTKTRKRIGRGPGSGLGGTSTRGHKGAKSRSGYSKKIGFEGGQMPLQRRVPKFGFKNINRVEYKAINLETIQKLAEAKNLTKVGMNDFIEAGFISSNQLVKVLGNGSLTTKLDVEANAFSKSAVAAIEAVGGNAVKL